MHITRKAVDDLYDIMRGTSRDGSLDGAERDKALDLNHMKFVRDPIRYIEDALARLDVIQRGAKNMSGGATGEPGVYVRAALRLLDELFAYVLRPFVESGFPVICITDRHVMLLVGISQDEHGPIFYFNDDQFGPYLISRSITAASREVFQAQTFTGKYKKQLGNAAPKADLARELDKLPAMDGWKGNRGAVSIVIPTPSRLLLSPVRAERHAVDKLVKVLGDAFQMKGRGELDAESLPSAMYSIRTVAMMGIDYKSARRVQLEADLTYKKFFSTAHLAEWIVVVEACSLADPEEVVQWEIAYDATSADLNPIVQLVRVQSRCLSVHPQDKGEVTGVVGPEVGLIE